MPIKTDRCRSCGAEIVWLVTKKGKRIPVDAETVDLELDELPVFEPRRSLMWTVAHRSHFATCPEADTWRTKK